MLDAETEQRAARSPAPSAFGSITAVLRSQPLLAPVIDSLDASALADIEASFEWFGMAGGTVLFHQGDHAEDTYIVVTGRFGVFLESGIGTRMIAQIGPGELVGEMSLLTGDPRSATVVALRDSEVVRIPSTAYERMMSSSPQLVLYLLRLLAGRLKSWHRGRLTMAAKTLAIIPLDRQVLDPEFGLGLQTAFSSPGLRIGLLDSRSAQLTGDEIAQVEEKHKLVLYVADRRDSAWSSRWWIRRWRLMTMRIG
jgi:NTE family protein